MRRSALSEAGESEQKSAVHEDEAKGLRTGMFVLISVTAGTILKVQRRPRCEITE